MPRREGDLPRRPPRRVRHPSHPAVGDSPQRVSLRSDPPSIPLLGRIRSRCLFWLSAALLAPYPVAAGPLDYLLDGVAPPPAFYLAPVIHTGRLYGPVGSPGAEANWLIAQWNIPTPLPARSTPTMTGWEVGNEHARVRVALRPRLAPAVTLAQNGAAIPCGTEFDLFIAPIDAITYPGYPEGLLAPNSPASPPIAALRSLWLEFTAAQRLEVVNRRCQPSGRHDYGYATVAVIVSNHRAGQVLYYQILLRDTRPELLGNACRYGSVPWWWSGPKQWGINDTLAVFGAPCLQPDGRAQTFRLDILDRLQRHLQEAPGPFAHDPSEWRVTGLYAGTGVEGSARMEITVSGLRLTAETE